MRPKALKGEVKDGPGGAVGDGRTDSMSCSYDSCCQAFIHHYRPLDNLTPLRALDTSTSLKYWLDEPF